jgi:hypothetical protein
VEGEGAEAKFVVACKGKRNCLGMLADERRVVFIVNVPCVIGTVCMA